MHRRISSRAARWQALPAPTVLRDPLYAACHPFNGCIFFRDDVRVEAGLAQGWFTLDVWAYCGFRTPGKYFLRVSLGHTLSDYVETVVS